MAEVTMPRLSDTMEEGTIAAWLKKPGEQVSKGDVLAQIETDKATMDLTAFEGGTLTEILAPEGTTVAIGKPVARIGSGSGSSAPAASPPAAQATGSETPKTPEAGENVAEAPEPAAPPTREASRPPTREESRPPATSPRGTTSDDDHPGPSGSSTTEESSATNGKVRASPMARHIAAEHGLNLSDIQGSGPQGRVIRADVEAALSGSKQAPAPREPQRAAPTDVDGDERVTLSQMRRTIARRMAESTRTVPHFYLTTSIDATDLGALRKQINAQTADAGIKITFNDLIVKGAALAIRQVPEVNVSFAEDSLIRHSRVHVGIAVATERGLIVPVLRDPDTKSVGAIARETRDLAERANAGKLQPPDYSGGTFTVSNLGMFGVEQFQAVINPPESAILAVGAITREPAEYQGEIALRDRLRLTLSVDHRALDGAIGARYLQALKALLEKPMLLLV
jgi:pyruvate dehydrogenase E2 component (dihydrolipoamide acetyltransferase)